MSLPFGKKIKVKNFYILKLSKSLSKKEVNSLRKDIPADIKKHLQRGSLPYIKVSALSEVWAIEFSIGTSMFEALDNLTPAQINGGLELTDNERNNAEALFQLMFTDTTLLGDDEYLIKKMKLREAFIMRESARRNAAEDAGKTEEQLRKESEDAVQEVIDRDKHAATIMEMGEQVAKDEAEKGGK